MEISQHLRAILSFVETSEAGSFSQAARKLGVSSAAVSKNVANLELVLGVRLLNRTTRKVSLTEEGATFLTQARVALEALESAVDRLAVSKMETSGHVRISTSAAFGREHLLPILPGLLTRYPALTVEVDFDDRVTDLINDGYDIAIRGGRIVDSSLISRPVCHLNLALVASSAYLAQNGVPQKPEDLVHHKLIARRFLGGKVNSWGFKAKDGSLYSFDPADPILTLSAPEALVETARAGVGIAQVGLHHALKYFEDGSLKALLTEQHDAGRYELVIQYPHRALIAPRVRATVDYLLAAFKQNKSLHFPIAELSQYQCPNSI